MLAIFVYSPLSSPHDINDSESRHNTLRNRSVLLNAAYTTTCLAMAWRKIALSVPTRRGALLSLRYIVRDDVAGLSQIGWDLSKGGYLF